MAPSHMHEKAKVVMNVAPSPIMTEPSVNPKKCRAQIIAIVRTYPVIIRSPRNLISLVFVAISIILYSRAEQYWDIVRIYLLHCSDIE